MVKVSSNSAQWPLRYRKRQSGRHCIFYTYNSGEKKNCVTREKKGVKKCANKCLIFVFHVKMMLLHKKTCNVYLLYKLIS